MSCHWDIGCKTCDTESGIFSENHGERGLLLLLAERGTIAQLVATRARFAASLDGWHAESFLFGHDSRVLSLAAFFTAHAGHDLSVKDEYGRWYEQCQEYFKCQCCGHQQACALAQKHGGDHAPKERRIHP